MPVQATINLYAINAQGVAGPVQIFSLTRPCPGGAVELHAGDILRQVYKAMLEDRGGKPLRADVARGVGEVVPTIIANLMLLHKVRARGARLVMSMDHRKLTRYDRLGFRQVPEVIDVMADLGFIIRHPHEVKKRSAPQ